MMILTLVVPSIVSLAADFPTLAYIGPGGGLSALGALLALAAAILIAVIGFLWYPLKRLRRNLRTRAAARAAETETNPAPPVEQSLQKGGQG